uniref:Acyl-coenzyme A thioesterase 8 n=1 Tax=Steinernema glaseri TaxID=37863 RepID=A0A1I8AK72_9BILA
MNRLLNVAMGRFVLSYRTLVRSLTKANFRVDQMRPLSSISSLFHLESIGSELYRCVDYLGKINSSPSQPVDYRVRHLRDGKSFCTRIVDAEQNGKVVFTCQISFHKQEKSSIEHSIKMPDVPPPEDLITDLEAISSFAEEEIVAEKETSKMKLLRMIREVEKKGGETVFEMKPTDIDAYFALKPLVPQCFYFWFRCSSTLPDDPTLHRCIQTYITDSTLISVAYRLHVSRGFIPEMTSTLDHNVWIHDADFRADEWMLYEAFSPIAINGRAFATARFWTRDGRLVMTCTQESLVRSRNPPSKL